MTKVIFEEPDIESLKREGYSCVDAHCHSRYSDGLSSIKSIYKKCRKTGIGVALTDHNEIRGNLAISKYKGINVIPGIETTSSEGIHTLFYFYKKSDMERFFSKVIIKSRGENPFSDLKLSIIDLVEKSKDYSCRICSAHPFGPQNTGIHKFAEKKEYKKTVKKIDFMEGVNASDLHSANLKSIKLARSMGKGITGGSDAHTMNFFGKVVTAVKGNDFLDGIGKNSLVVGTEVNPALFVFRNLLKMRLFSKYPKFYIKKLMHCSAPK